jgi:hypothetical protein
MEPRIARRAAKLIELAGVALMWPEESECYDHVMESGGTGGAHTIWNPKFPLLRCTPDAHIWADWNFCLMEIKTSASRPSREDMATYGMRASYWWQAQAQLMVTRRLKCYVCAVLMMDGEPLRLKIREVTPDPDAWALIEERVARFVHFLETKTEPTGEWGAP